MKGGRGETSYLKNSQAQARHARAMLHFLEATLSAMKLPLLEDGRFAVADLGCSCGTNTLFLMGIVVEHVSKMYAALGHDSPEFQVFFSDLPCNDFNVLFQLLPPQLSSSSLAAAKEHLSYYAAGVPGSFYGRLFPSRSINFFNSTFSLHWLSQVPERVTDKRSPAYNRGRVFVHGASADTVAAYKQQFQADLASFLRARAVEMTVGGVMFLVCLGRTSIDPADQGGAGFLFGAHFQDAWNDLVEEASTHSHRVHGLLDSEKRDSFNIPVYAAFLREFEDVVKAEGSLSINKLQVVKGASPLVVDHPEDASEVGRALANSCRSVAGVLVEAHIGERLSEELFGRLELRAARHARELMERMQFFHIVASLSPSRPSHPAS
ncbi:SAM dependent carboxyl methyltransferase [Musa troglodytarum]|uniref:SAM dependent carboxyl methyltransferase n=1 Tax=Musa troglodytarum TaxID=320322 RepID=A0A9E7EDJ9_9LILI|nr:SAM dependent carboxyl methyltransferase [Musa troglodytarum]